MPHAMRVFCRKATVPTPGEILQALSAAKLPAQLEPDAAVDLENPNWEQLQIVIAPGHAPLIVDRDCEGNGSHVRDEVREFLDVLEAAPNSGAKREVAAQLKRTKQVVCLEVPTSDIDPTGWAVAHALVRLLVKTSDGLLQADGEGFYRGNDLILELT